MSFTADIKNQLTELDNKKAIQRRAEFYGIFVSTEESLRTHSAAVAKRAEKMCLRAGGVISRRFYRAGVKEVYGLEMRWSGSFSLDQPDAAAAFLRGCFLVGGYIHEPDSPAHLEISFRSVTAYELAMAAFELCGIAPKGTIKGRKYVLYLKDAEQISAFLVTIGAIRGMLEYENVRITREGRRNSNRVINCDDANINKALSAGARQVSMIERVSGTDAFRELPEGVQEIARLRLDNPELSLSELGELCVPPVSKAGASHRFAKIENLYKSLSGEAE